MKAQAIIIDESRFSTVVVCTRCDWRSAHGNAARARTTAAQHLKNSHEDLLAARRIRHLVTRLKKET